MEDKPGKKTEFFPPTHSERIGKRYSHAALAM